MANGFVMLPRFITTRDWYSDPIARAVFIDLLLQASWKDEEIRGEQLRLGQLITSLAEIAEKNKIKPSHARSILSRIERTNDIASRSTSKFRIITVLCVDCESDDSKVESKQTASTPTDTEQGYIIINNKQVEERKVTPAQTRESLSDERFDLFWAAYPKKQNKGGAKKAWSRIKPTAELFEKIMAALELAKKSEQWRKDKGQFIPYPATWLNGERWEDDYSSISPASPPSLSDFDPDNPYADWGDEV